MADINKSALLILNSDSTKFLVTRADNPKVPYWLLPGGQIEKNESVTGALAREIEEELGCKVDSTTLAFVGEYEAPAAGRPDKIVNIKLYSGVLLGQPQPNSEVVELKWLGADEVNDPMVSEIIRSKMVPDLVSRQVLRIK